MEKKTERSSKNKNTTTVSIQEYAQILAELKQKIQEAQVKAVLSANKDLIKVYWFIGRTIAEKQEKSGWGTKIIEQLAKDLQNAFPGIQGFSRANVFNMRAFYLAYEKVQQPARQFHDLAIFNIPWWHNVILLTKIKENNQRLWYAQKAIDHGWSRSMLETWIESDLYHREGRAITNFQKTLPAAQSDMANQSLKDPYIFGFLTLHREHLEKEVEQGLVDHIQKFLMELGHGFAFVGRQYHLEIDGKDYYIDLLFYNFRLHCFFIVELKAREFEPQDAGQINFYLSAVDDVLRSAEDKPTIGLILCKTKGNFTAEYALRDINKPIGIAGYTTKLVESLPKEFKNSLPTVEEIEAELEKQERLSEKSI